MLNEAKLPVVRQGVTQQRHRFVIVNAAQENGVHLDGKEPCFFRRLDSSDDVVESIAVSHLFESLRIQRVQTDIHTLESCIREVLCEFGQLKTIRGQRNLRRVRQGVQAPNHVHDVWPKQGFTAGQTHLVDAHFRGDFEHQHHLVG